MVGAVAVASCVHVDHVRGPDGKDDWLAVSCSGTRTNCYQAAADECPHGYVIADSAGGSTTYVSATKNAMFVSSTEHGDLLIKCKTPSAGEGTSQCDAAYRAIGGLPALWAKWFQGDAVTTPPGPVAFMRVCGALNEDLQLCLVTPYAEHHEEACIAKFSTLPQATRDRLDAMLMRTPEDDD
jgi:hypothetical protein